MLRRRGTVFRYILMSYLVFMFKEFGRDIFNMQYGLNHFLKDVVRACVSQANQNEGIRVMYNLHLL